MTTSHSAFGASNCKRWMTCPGSVKLSEGLEDYETTYAAEGTRAHKMAEKALGQYLSTISGGWAPEEYEVPPEDLDFVTEMGESIYKYTEAVRITAALPREGGMTYSIEHRLSQNFSSCDAFGTADLTLQFDGDDMVYVFDLKYGVGERIFAKGNHQLMFYAAGLLTENPRLNGILMTIVQPRLDHVDSHFVTAEDLVDFRERMIYAIGDAMSAGPTFTAGEHCHYCRASGRCPEQARKSVALLTAIDTTKAISLMTPEDLSKALDAISPFRQWASAVEARAEHMAHSGEDIPGYDLRSSRNYRRWTDELQVISTLMEWGLSWSSVMDSKLKTVAEIEKLLKKSSTRMPSEWVRYVPSEARLLRVPPVEVPLEGAFDFLENE